MAAMLRGLLLTFCLFAGALLATPQGYHSFVRGGELGSFLASLLNSRPRIDAWFFSAGRYALCVLDEGDSGARYGSLENAMHAEGCVAGINGGYFADDAASTPLGLLCHAGQCISPMASGSFTVAGVLYDTGRELRLERTRRLSTAPARLREAIQGGPFLVEHGRKIAGLNATKRARRSFVATDGKGNWCFAVSSPLTLDALAAWLASGTALGSFRVQTALNMDGGTSSAFWVATPQVYQPGVKAVRNYIGVTPRRAGAKKS